MESSIATRVRLSNLNWKNSGSDGSQCAFMIHSDAFHFTVLSITTT